MATTTRGVPVRGWWLPRPLKVWAIILAVAVVLIAIFLPTIETEYSHFEANVNTTTPSAQ